MFRISRLTDYGIVVMAHLAGCEDDDSHNARELAEETRLPAPFVSKILKSLTRAGLLSSSRGMKGGYMLAYSPLDISIADIVAAVEGPIALTHCIEDAPGACELESCCRVRDALQVLNNTVRQALREVSLADLAAH